MTVVIAKCILCGVKREIRSGEVEPNDVPVCNICQGPMLAVKAIYREKKDKLTLEQKRERKRLRELAFIDFDRKIKI